MPSSYCRRRSKCRSKTPSWFSMLTFIRFALVANVCCALDVLTAKHASHPSTMLETSNGQSNHYTMGVTTLASSKLNGDDGKSTSSVLQLISLPALTPERIGTKQTVITNAESADRRVSEPPAGTKRNHSDAVITRVNSSAGQSYTLVDVTTRVNNATGKSSSGVTGVTTNVNRSNGESASQFLDLATRVNSVTRHAPPVEEASGNGTSRRVNVPERFEDTVARRRIEEPTSVIFNPNDVEDKKSAEGPNNALYGFMSDEGLDSNNVENEIPNDPEVLDVPFSESNVPQSTLTYLVTTTTTTSSQNNDIGHIPAPTTKRTTVPVANNTHISRPNETKETTKADSGQNETSEGKNRTVVTTDSLLSAMTTRQLEPPSPKPFLVIWNIPSKKCGTRYGILPKLTKYGILHNTHQHFYGEEIVIFYANHLGFYPRLLADGEVVNGGIPQLANMDMHLAKARGDIEKRIPNANFSGYGVIDWESWRPIFRRNWGVHRMYKDRAVKAIAKQYPSWNYTTVKAYAKKEFDISARRFITATLSLAKDLRPLAKWGFYLFPDCYNFRNGQDYCDKKQTKRNDRLWWLFRASGALYPSIYLTQKLRPKYRAGHIKGILQEGYRIQKTHTNRARTPVLPYARIRYSDTNFLLSRLKIGESLKETDYRIRYSDTNFLLSRNDLEGTIGQAATSGSSGIVLWEKYANTVGKRKCVQLKKYVQKMLGPFLMTLQRFVTDCSKTLCEGRGRCVRKKHFPSKTRPHHYKHGFVSMFAKHQRRYDQAFRCSCFEGWRGTRCEWKDIDN